MILGGADGSEGRQDDHRYRVLARTERFRNGIFKVLTDQVAMPDGASAARDYLVHVGAVGVVAIDDAGRVVLIRQYRHPVGGYLWELPAGLIDVPGEQLAEAAARELAEEADLVARRWSVLADVHTTPGCSNEVIRLFLARDLVAVPEQQRHQRHAEEADLRVQLVDLDDAVTAALRGEITNGPCLVGLLAAAQSRSQGWRELRRLDEPLPQTSPA